MAEVKSDKVGDGNIEEGLLKPGALLHTMRLMDVTRKPLMMEFPVPDSPPFLVSASRGLQLMWIPTARRGRVRAAVQPIPDTASFFRKVVDETQAMGLASEWGNVHPLTEDGINAAIEHPKYYGLDELTILASPRVDWGAINKKWKVKEGNTLGMLNKLPVEAAPWLDPLTIVVVPRNRGFVGFVIEIGEGHAIAVIHNASRGIGIATANHAQPVAGDVVDEGEDEPAGEG